MYSFNVLIFNKTGSYLAFNIFAPEMTVKEFSLTVFIHFKGES